MLNGMWRNGCINDTYEPGSTFKIVTAAAGLESGAVKPTDTFNCPGFIMVEDRKIRCHKVGGHGAEDFVQGTMNFATLSLLRSDYGSEWSSTTPISNNLGC